MTFTQNSCVKTKRELTYRKGASRPTPFTVVSVIANTEAFIESSTTAFYRDVLGCLCAERTCVFVLFVNSLPRLEAYRLSLRLYCTKTRSMKSQYQLIGKLVMVFDKQVDDIRKDIKPPLCASRKHVK